MTHTIITRTDRRTGQQFECCEKCEVHESMLRSSNCYMWQPGDDDE